MSDDKYTIFYRILHLCPAKQPGNGQGSLPADKSREKMPGPIVFFEEFVRKLARNPDE